MWLKFIVISVVALGLMVPELRRLASKYGLLLCATVGGCAVMLVSGWLLVLALVASDLAGSLSTLRLWQLAFTFILPFSTFLYARRRYSVTPSLFPAGLLFAAVSMVFVGIEFSYGY